MAMDLFWAFLVGGALCAVGQVLIDYTKLTPARILTAYVVAGVALSAVGIYPKLVELAGGGASVPLTGFGNLLAEGVRESVDEKGLLGIFMGGLTASSAGITAAMVFAAAYSGGSSVIAGELRSVSCHCFGVSENSSLAASGQAGEMSYSIKSP